jgi:hypothetical protein
MTVLACSGWAGLESVAERFTKLRVGSLIGSLS